MTRHQARLVSAVEGEEARKHVSNARTSGMHTATFVLHTIVSLAWLLPLIQDESASNDPLLGRLVAARNTRRR